MLKNKIKKIFSSECDPDSWRILLSCRSWGFHSVTYCDKHISCVYTDIVKKTNQCASASGSLAISFCFAL